MMLTLLALIACVEDVAKDKIEAVVEEPPPVEQPAPAEPGEGAEVAGDPWIVNVEQSKIEALGAKITAKHPITFHDFEGKIHVADGKPTGVMFTVQMKTLTSDNEKLTNHLLTPDFFDVEQFPTAEFRSTEITEGSDAEGMTHTIKGDFTIHGKTKRITFPARLELGEGEVKASTEFALNRQDFGITYPGKPDDLIQDNVVLTVELVAPGA